MSAPLSADRFLEALRAEGLAVVEHPGWRTHNRNHKGPWGPVHGVLVHHTVTKGTAATVRICREGHSTLPGPLCHGVIAKDGTVHLVGYGRTNHAGLGDPDVLRAVIDERPAPADDQATTDGNRHFYGFECENLGDGVDPWPAAQLDAIARASAALCRAHGWGARSVIGHLEWQPGKVDPRGFTMASMRDRVDGRLDDKPTPPKPTAPSKPKPTPPARPAVSLSLLVRAATADPAKKGTPVSYAGARIVEEALAAEGLLDRTLVDGHFGTATRTAYGRWQARLGYRGRAADGIPGPSSLAALGKKRGFAVAA
ncbi:N-acetylmuramoyl-L-alanine amidase [Streptomyces sp. WAC01280]|uniref:N-acetylmuramoyl-L-alanine amidase n=1 Tax=Streptomyces sp. WAC01280 TaxID=2487424 RepID=UPI000F79421E|nr:N-acetylmuramoyl-L-alanine amidase [Streptomyces sp. WAC01280]RSS59585.1 N-acetylmuramoyl-L-alanine amidase [Streptomyces sp. WAC01280]